MAENSKKAAPGDFRFPKGLARGGTTWLQLTAVEASLFTTMKDKVIEETTGKTLQDQLKKEKVGSVSLLITDGVTDSTRHNWNTDPLWSAGPDGNASTTDKGKLLPGSTGQWINAVGKGGKLFGFLAPPMYMATYNATELRSFSFSFSLLPQSSEDALEIQKIILALKAWSSPGGFGIKADSFQYPYYVFPNILFAKGNSGETASKVDNLINFRLSIIENVNVSYFDSGSVSAYNDSMPKSIRLEVGIKEIFTNYRDDYSKKLESLG